MRIKSLLTSSIFILLTVFSVFHPQKIHAATDPTQEMVRIYCERRDSANVSLEQWYGGKCTSSNTAELIGFGDIVILDLMEKLGGGNGQEIDLNGFIQQLQGKAPTFYNTGYAVLPFKGNVGAIQNMGSLIGATMTNPPATSIDYLADVSRNINRHSPVQPAYAQATTQGFGFASMSMVLPLWKAFRNLTYLIFTLVFVMYGFMIMLRVKISAQAVTTIQLALPRIITTLLAITFSYAIAGLMIDLFYVIVGLIMNTLSNDAVKIITDKAHAEWVSGLSSGLYGPISSIFVHIITWSLSYRMMGAIIPSGVLGNLGQLILTASLGSIINVILLIAILIVSIKIWWTLLQSNIRLVLKVMFAPLILVQNVFPNSSAISEWIKSIVAELSVFASTMVLFVLAFYFIGPLHPFGVPTDTFKVGELPTGGRTFSPPPFFTSVTAQDEGGKLTIIGLGIFLMIPKLADTVRSKFEKDSPFAFGKELSGPLGMGAKTLMAPYNWRQEQKKKALESGRPAGTSSS